MERGTPLPIKIDGSPRGQHITTIIMDDPILNEACNEPIEIEDELIPRKPKIGMRPVPLEPYYQDPMGVPRGPERLRPKHLKRKEHVIPDRE